MVEVRGCKHEELWKVIPFLNSVFSEARGSEVQIDKELPLLFTKKNIENLVLVEDKDRLVSVVGILPINLKILNNSYKIGLIGCVSTPKEFRKKGYASKALEYATTRMKELGCSFSLLWTDVPGLYRNLDWEYGGTHYKYSIDKNHADSLPGLNNNLEFLKFDKEDLESLRDISRVYFKKNKYQVEMRKDDKIQVLKSPRFKIFGSRKGGKVDSYAVLKGFRVQEFGGDFECVLGILKNVLNSTNQGMLNLIVPSNEKDKLNLLDRLKLPKEEEDVAMIKILENRENLKKMYCLKKEDVDGLSNGELVKLLFNKQDPKKEPAIYPFFMWGTDHI